MSDIPDIEDLLGRIHVVGLPLRAKFRGVTTKEAVLIDGPAGWGEFAPFVEYNDAEASTWLASGIEAAYRGFPEAQRDYVEVNATVPAVDPEEVPGILEGYPGCRVVKVKVAEKGQDLHADKARVDAVRAVRPGAVIRVDANGGWSVAEALRAADVLGPLAYLEQPCATVEELAEVRSKLQRAGIFVRVAADESVRRATDPYRVAELRAADVAVVKAAPLGGVGKLLEVAEHLSQRHLDITVASALDTAVGISAGLAAVAALPVRIDDDGEDVAPAAAGLATGSLFIEDVAQPREIIEGRLATSAVVPEAERVADLSVSEKRRDFWIKRLRRCHDVLVMKEGMKQ